MSFANFVAESMDDQKPRLEQRNRNRDRRDDSDDDIKYDYNIFRGVDKWSVVEFIMGMTIGAYDTLQSAAYDNNCFSRVFSFTQDLIEDTEYFDKGIPKDGWVETWRFWGQMTGTTFRLIGITAKCA